MRLLQLRLLAFARADRQQWNHAAVIVCGLMLPDDARPRDEVTLKDGTKDVIYASPLLAATFPASAFHNASGQSVEAGTAHFAMAPSAKVPGGIASRTVTPGRL